MSLNTITLPYPNLYIYIYIYIRNVTKCPVLLRTFKKLKNYVFLFK